MNIGTFRKSAAIKGQIMKKLRPNWSYFCDDDVYMTCYGRLVTLAECGVTSHAVQCCPDYNGRWCSSAGPAITTT